MYLRNAKYGLCIMPGKIATENEISSQRTGDCLLHDDVNYAKSAKRPLTVGENNRRCRGK